MTGRWSINPASSIRWHLCNAVGLTRTFHICCCMLTERSASHVLRMQHQMQYQLTGAHLPEGTCFGDGLKSVSTNVQSGQR